MAASPAANEIGRQTAAVQAPSTSRNVGVMIAQAANATETAANNQETGKRAEACCEEIPPDCPSAALCAKDGPTIVFEDVSTAVGGGFDSGVLVRSQSTKRAKLSRSVNRAWRMQHLKATSSAHQTASASL